MIKKLLAILLLASCACATTSGEKITPGMSEFLDQIQARGGTVHIDIYKPGTIIEVFEGPGGYIVVVERDRSKIPNESDEDIPVNPSVLKNQYSVNDE